MAPKKKKTYALVRGPKGRPTPQVRELASRADAESARRDHDQRKRGSVTDWRVVADSTLDSKPRGRGGLAGTGDDATRRSKAEEANKRRADRDRMREKRRR